MRPSTRDLLALLAALAAVTAGCAGQEREAASGPTTSSRSTPTDQTTPATPAAPPATATSPSVTPAPAADPDRVRAETAMDVVRHLAERVGPRPGTSAAYRRAADWVERRLERLGWEVRRQPVPTPAGVSWGVPVPAGRSVNLVATRPDAPPGPWLVAGAHLDTVPQAPGAEDNASGVGALVAVAEALAQRRTRLPVTLVVFGSEEPRGPTDDDHHYGSRRYVASLTPAERRTLRGMVALDRVGVGTAMPVASAGPPDRVRGELLAAARRAGVRTVAETEQRSSDHWSFVRDGLPGARLGSTPYAGYHSAGDVTAVVDPAQLARAARTTVAWVAPRGG